MLQIKRAYEPYQKKDGYRVLVDRLWPRGIKKEDLKIDEWAKELAPSTELRKFFNHDEHCWKEFQSRYRKELRAKEANDKLKELAHKSQNETVTLLFSAKDEKHNNAVVLQRCLRDKLKRLS